MLPKDECQVLINPDQKQILESPAGLKLEKVSRHNETINTTFTIQVSPQDKDYGFGLFSFAFSDAAGKEYHMKSQGTSTGTEEQHIMISLPDEPYVYPLRLTIDDYPNRVVKEFHYKIK